MSGMQHGILIVIGFFVISGIGCAQQPSEKKSSETKQAVQKSSQMIYEPQQTKENKKSLVVSNEIKKKEKMTLVELGSVKCIPCKKMKPLLDEIEEKYNEQVDVVFHDVWTKEGGQDAEKYKIRLIPTQVFLDKSGKQYFRHEGFYPLEEIIKKLKEGGLEE
ncbi:MAG: thioredoxin family protein [bacterium]